MTAPGQILTFFLGDEEYGVDILRVQEIRGMAPITAIPNVPPHVRGVINLRGTVVPIVDLRACFAMAAAAVTRVSVFVIVNVAGRVVGLLVDSVSDVLVVSAEMSQPPPDLGTAVDTSFMSGMARCGERLILLLDVDRLLGAEPELGAQERV